MASLCIFPSFFSWLELPYRDWIASFKILFSYRVTNWLEDALSSTETSSKARKHIYSTWNWLTMLEISSKRKLNRGMDSHRGAFWDWGISRKWSRSTLVSFKSLAVKFPIEAASEKLMLKYSSISYWYTCCKELKMIDYSIWMTPSGSRHS